MMMSTVFLIACTVLYLIICFFYIYEGNYWMAIAFGGYAVANIGFILMAFLGPLP